MNWTEVILPRRQNIEIEWVRRLDLHDQVALRRLDLDSRLPLRIAFCHLVDRLTLFFQCINGTMEAIGVTTMRTSVITIGLKPLGVYDSAFSLHDFQCIKVVSLSNGVRCWANVTSY